MTGNEHKRQARNYQQKHGGSYTRAHREVAKRHAPPLIVSFPGTNGQPVRLNLEELSRGGPGPHCLINGVTRSGKSTLAEHVCRELAKSQQSYGLDLFMFQELATDRQFPSGTARYTGGAALPDVVNSLTNERVNRLSTGKFRDITEYRRAGLHMPAAVVCIDQLDRIADGEPEVLDAVSRVARIGRSLGVHLVLTSERPAVSLRSAIAESITTTVHLRSTTFAGIPGLPHLALGQGVLQLAGQHDLQHFTFPDYRLSLPELDAVDGHADTI